LTPITDTKRAKPSHKLDAKFRVTFSGTPIENYIDEYSSLLNAINPGLLGSRESFLRRFAALIERHRKARRSGRVSRASWPFSRNSPRSYSVLPKSRS
jgi:SNF2 family DNA or RNA helicase